MLSTVSDTLIDEGVATDDDGSGEGAGERGRYPRFWVDTLLPWLTREDTQVDEDGERGARWQRIAGWVVVAICTLMVINIIDPHSSWWPIWRPHFGWLFKNKSESVSKQELLIFLTPSIVKA